MGTCGDDNCYACGPVLGTVVAGTSDADKKTAKDKCIAKTACKYDDTKFECTPKGACTVASGTTALDCKGCTKAVCTGTSFSATCIYSTATDSTGGC